MTTKRGSGVAVRVESVGGRVQRLHPGVRRAEIFFRLHRRRASIASFRRAVVAPAPCRDLVAKTLRHELSRSPTLHPHLNAIGHWPSYPGSTLMARDRTMTEVKSEIVLSIIISILARCVSGTASVGLKAVAVFYPR
jgi:hypothetical protein